MKEFEILKEINQNAKMGMDSLSTVLKKSQDTKFKDLLNTQHNEYQNIYDRTQELLVKIIFKWKILQLCKKQCLGWVFNLIL